jgi:phosphatidylglycerophosphatase A
MPRPLAIVVGTCFGVGLIPVIPATWTSLLVAALLLAFHAGSVPLQSTLLAATLVLGVPACSALERIYGHDPKQATVDEVAGMLITLLAVPLDWINVGAAFVLFRAFDVLKLPPARQAERLPAGWGVMADDVIAGIQARIVVGMMLWARTHLG